MKTQTKIRGSNSSDRLKKMMERLHDLILVPGLLCNERLWAAQANALADSAHVIIPDLTAYESVETMAEAVLDQVPGEFSLAGFSLGGCVALEVVQRAPDRARRLALLSTSPKGISPEVRKHYLDSIASIEAGSFDAYLATPSRSTWPPSGSRPGAVGHLLDYGQEPRSFRRRATDAQSSGIPWIQGRPRPDSLPYGRYLRAGGPPHSRGRPRGTGWANSRSQAQGD